MMAATETVVMVALTQSKLSPKFLELEITESMLIDKRYSNLGYFNK